MAPFALFVGRHIRDKGVDLLPDVIEAVAAGKPQVHFVVVGDGPLRGWLETEVERRKLGEFVDVRGFVPDEELEGLLDDAACLIAPSRREGYGIAIVDAMSHGTPVVTAAFEENLSVDHVQMENGRVADPPTAGNLALSILGVVAAGDELRRSTSDWYRTHADSKSVESSVDQMVAYYGTCLRRSSKGG